MLFNIIMLVGMYPVIFILYFVFKTCGKNKNGIVFGVRIPKDAGTAQEFAELVEEKRKTYYRRMRGTFFVFLFIPCVCFLIPYISIQFTIWMLWLLAAIVFLELPYIRANRELMRWKKEKMLYVKAAEEWSEACDDGAEEKKNAANAMCAEGSEQEGFDVPDEVAEQQALQSGQNERIESEMIRRFELQQAGAVRRVRAKDFLPPVILSAGVVLICLFFRENIYQRFMLWLVAVFALCTPTFYAVAVWMDRQRTAVINRDSEVNLNFARAKKQIWSRLWLLCAWGNTVFTVFVAAAAMRKEASANWIVWGCVFYSLLLLAFCAKAIAKVSRLEERYGGKTDTALQGDDDADWLWGCVYYNKSDRRTLVEARTGFGTSTNLATPVGKGLTMFGVGALLLVPVVCIWMILLEFTPIRLEIRGNDLVAEQLTTDYRIPIENIAELELVSELPELSKNAGTGMDNLYKGDWHILYAGDCEVFLNPQNGLFLRFTADGELYYMSAADDEGTQAVYDALRKVLP